MSLKSGLRLYHLKPTQTVLMLCDVQEKFKPAIPIFEAVVENAKKLVTFEKYFIYKFVSKYHPPIDYCRENI